MALLHLIVGILTLMPLIKAQMVSPCPRLFTYEPQKENDRWYGVVTLISESDLSGVWLRLIFDKPSLQLGNWFGEIKTTDNKEYLIKNRNHQLKANMPFALRFYIKYDPSEQPPPQLMAFRLNAKTVCPEGESSTPAAITGGGQLQTSNPGASDSITTPVPRPSRPSGGGGQTFSRPGGGWQPPTESDDDGVFAGDFQLINRPHLKPNLDIECGTIVKRNRRKRQTFYSYGNYQHHHRQNYEVYPVHPDRQRPLQISPNQNFYEYISAIIDNINNYNMNQQNYAQTGYIPTSNMENNRNPNSNNKAVVYKPIQNPTALNALNSKGNNNPTSNKKTTHGQIEYKPATNELNHFMGRNPSFYVSNGGFIDDNVAPIEAQPKPLITYGQKTMEGEYPWHAALYHERGADLQYICGASLLSRHHVITVAHCVTRRRSATTLNPDSLVVYLGKYYLKKWSNPGIQDSQVSMIFPHPEYNSQTYANDIALIKLVNAATFTDFVRPICLWSDNEDLNTVLDKSGTVVGWGFDHTGKVTEALTMAKMPVVSKETCIYSFPDFFSRFTTSKTYCAGFRNGTSVCNGDSGGGMVFPKSTSTPNRQIWQLRGLVSISVALQNQFRCDSSHYVVFTDVAKYTDWIRSTMAKM